MKNKFNHFRTKVAGWVMPPATPEPVIPEIPEEVKKRGRIVKVTARPDYEPDKSTHGGRIIRTMPRSLKKIKEAQEKHVEV